MPPTPLQLEPDHTLAAATITAIQTGDTPTLTRLLTENPSLATARIGPRTPLHIATDWPGNFPNGPQTVALLIARGAEVNVRFTGRHTETPLHWAASCDDVPVLDTLLDCGADIEAEGAVIANGTPLADAVAFAQWNAARRLIERGAAANLWQAAALGLIDRLKALAPITDQAEITSAFWCACHGGQRETAEYLLAQGAQLNWTGYDHLTPLAAALRSKAAALAEWLISQGAK